jgi:hypothetical protein
LTGFVTLDAVIRVALADRRMFDECPAQSPELPFAAAAFRLHRLSAAHRDLPPSGGDSEKKRALPARFPFASTIRGSLWRQRRANLCAK